MYICIYYFDWVFNITKGLMTLTDTCTFVLTILTGFLDFCDIPDLMAHLQENYRYWKEKSEDEASWWLKHCSGWQVWFWVNHSNPIHKPEYKPKVWTRVKLVWMRVWTDVKQYEPEWNEPVCPIVTQVAVDWTARCFLPHFCMNMDTSARR